MYKIKLRVRLGLGLGLRVAAIKNASYVRLQVRSAFGLRSCRDSKAKQVTSQALLLTICFENIKSIVFVQIQNT